MLVQLVEIPGLIEGAAEDRGGGRALLGVLRSVDAIVYCAGPMAIRPSSGRVRARSPSAGIEKPAFLAATRADEADRRAIERLAAAFPELEVVAGLGPRRGQPRRLPGGRLAADRPASGSAFGPAARPRRSPWRSTPGATVADVADWVHHDLAATFGGARVWGPSARFDGQRVGRDHAVQDGDVVEILR